MYFGLQETMSDASSSLIINKNIIIVTGILDISLAIEWPNITTKLLMHIHVVHTVQ